MAMAPKNAKDHWAFLEEIEAPMWVDLAQEAAYSDSDDGWFHVSHTFHKQSSKQLKAAFAHSGEETLSSDFGLLGQSSPQLPSSVSRSRGKHLASKNLQKGIRDLGMNEQHPVRALKGKSSLVSSVLDEVRKPKVSVVNSRGTSKSQVSSGSERALIGCIKDNGKLPLGNDQNSEDGSSSAGDRAGEANTSILTSETYQKPHRRNLELYSRALGNKSSIFAEVRISLRKSCVRRQAGCVEINNDTAQTTNHSASSGMFGVGSSENPGFDCKRETNYRPSSGKSSWGSSSSSANDVKGNRVLKSSSAKSSVGSSFNPYGDVKGNTVRKSSSAKSSLGSSSNSCAYLESKPNHRSSSGMSSAESSSKPCGNVKSEPNHKSLSSKPSISSSSNPGRDVKCSGLALMRGKERTSVSRIVTSNSMAAMKKVQGSRILRDSSNIQLKDGPRNTRLVNKVKLAKSSANLQPTKQKALIQTASVETRQLHQVQEKDLLIGAAATKQKLGISIAGANRLVGTGKENTKARTCGKQKGSVVAGGGLTNGQTKKTPNTTSKGDITSLDNPKEKPCNHPITGKQRPVATTQRPHFR